MCPDVWDECHYLDERCVRIFWMSIITWKKLRIQMFGMTWMSTIKWMRDVSGFLDECHNLDERRVRMFGMSIITWLRDVSRSLG